MPQPALHLLMGRDQLAAWRSTPDAGPLDVDDAAAANAFLVGCLGPDLGLFPGGDTRLSRLAHTQRTGELARALFAHARTAEQRAFAWGWISHFTADVAIHPIVNGAAAASARGRGVAPRLTDHVRVEVGLDAWFASRAPDPTALRVAAAFDRREWTFVARAFGDVHGYTVLPRQLVQMQARMLAFTRLAVHFATRAARSLCWNETAPAPVPAATALVWHLATRMSAPHTMVHAYLQPSPPSPALVAATTAGMEAARLELERCVSAGPGALADYDLETGILNERTRSVA